jgi:hypothetical protein
MQQERTRRCQPGLLALTGAAGNMADTQAHIAHAEIPQPILLVRGKAKAALCAPSIRCKSDCMQQELHPNIRACTPAHSPAIQCG